LLSSGPAQAEWLSVDRNDELGVSTYIDPGTIRRNGNIVKRWEMMDFNTIQTAGNNSFLSVKMQKEYDCADDRFRILAVTEFSGKMGRGNVVYSKDDWNQKWSAVQPESIGQALWEIACRTK
jgi:hypothetical protein